MYIQYSFSNIQDCLCVTNPWNIKDIPRFEREAADYLAAAYRQTSQEMKLPNITELAKRCGVSRDTLYRYLPITSEPQTIVSCTFEMLLKISTAMRGNSLIIVLENGPVKKCCSCLMTRHH